ncbi:hypothetical protein AB0940_31800 [Streptomyces sp. NPDC006656]|uniref:hypothetical protein n=1 Tax=Streptomyces sp. NPDC006656 TaxID=3156899 RepID=UPI003452E56F
MVLVPPVEPMLAKAGEVLPGAGALAYEQKWDGQRALLLTPAVLLGPQHMSGRQPVPYTELAASIFLRLRPL